MIVEQEVAGALGSHKTGGWRNDLDNQGASIPAIAPTLPAHGNDTGGDRPPGTTADTADSLIAGTVSSKWAKGSVSVAFTQNTRDEVRKIGGDGQTAGALGSNEGMKQRNYVAQGISGGETGFALRADPSHSGDKGDGGVNTNFAVGPMTVRRLTPRECERLMGFPDDHTLIPWRGKPAELCPDGPRYRALGNSMAVPVMRWIGERIQMVEELLS
jgi:DNA (cytosine-5)-methyltransferase 1